MKILLIFPPFWYTRLPYPSLPVLKAFLEKQNHQVILLDFNLVIEEWILHNNNLDIFFEIIQPLLEELFTKISNPTKMTLSNYIDQEYISLSQTRLAKKFLRQKSNYHKNHKKPFDIQYYMEVYLNFSQHIESFFTYYIYSYYDLYKSKDISILTTDYHRNLLLHIAEKFMLQKFIEIKPDIIGFSLIFQGQLVSTFTLASLLKKYIPDTHITIGGPYLSRLLPRNLKKLGSLFKFIDSIILGEGEIPLSNLSNTLSSGKKDFSNINNLVFFKKDEVIVNKFSSNDINLNDLPCPDYDGLPLYKYLSPYPILSIQTSRNCYWGRCVYCNEVNLKDKYREKHAEFVVNDMYYLKNKFNDAIFLFADDATSPSQCENISNLILERKINVRWFTEIRAEPLFSKKLCELMYLAGARAVQIGLESINNRVLKLTNKGTNVEIFPQIIKNFSDTNILINLFLMAFPGETKEELLNTYDFIEKNLNIIHSFDFNYTTTLFVNTPMWKNPSKFSLKLNTHPQRDINIIEDYKYICENYNNYYYDLLEIKAKFNKLLDKIRNTRNDFFIETILRCIRF